MAVVLTSAYSDTGDTDSFTISGSVEVNASGQGSSVRLALRGTSLFFVGTQTHWILREVYSFDGVNYISDLYLTQPLGDNLGFPPFPTLIQHLVHGPSPPVAATYFAPVSFATTIGPFRLGAKFNLSTGGGPSTAPSGLADQNTLRHAWFADADSYFDETVGGVNETRQIAAIPTLQTTDVAKFSCSAGTITGVLSVPIAKFTAVTVQGNLLDTDGVDDAPLLYPRYSQVAAGAFNINNAAFGGDFIEAAPGGELTFVLDMLDYAGATVSPDLLDNWVTQPQTFHAAPKTPNATFLTAGTYSTDFQTNYPRSEKNLPGSVTHSTNVSISPAWLAANGYDPNDLTAVLDQHSPITGSTTYSPILIEQKGSVEIDTPAGGRPSSWAINSGANGSVTENAGDTVFLVTNTAAVFTRNYATNWRAYTVNSHILPEWNIDGYTFLRRHYAADYLGIPQTVHPEDYWWWNSYMFLRLNITATAAATLTLTVSGIDLQVNDNHSGIPGVRSAAITYNQFNDTRTYVFDVSIGTADVWIDLSFPDSYVAAGGAVFPMRRPRVESLVLSASAVGTYTLNAMELSRRDPAGYATEVSVCYSPQSTYNAEWPAVYLRTDGEAAPVLTYGDAYKKGLEAELGGAIRFAEPEAGSVSQARAMWEQLQRIEGFTVTYTDGDRAVFMEDTFGVALVTQAGEPAQFAREVAPGAVFVGAGDAHGYSPDFCIRVGAVIFPNGLSLTIRPRHVFGGGVEAVAMADGTRAGAGLNFDLLDQANTTLASVVSDTRGRIHFEPIGHGKVVRFVPA